MFDNVFSFIQIQLETKSLFKLKTFTVKGKIRYPIFLKHFVMIGLLLLLLVIICSPYKLKYFLNCLVTTRARLSIFVLMNKGRIGIIIGKEVWDCEEKYLTSLFLDQQEVGEVSMYPQLGNLE